MASGARHLIGVIVGLAAIPLVLYLMSRQVELVAQATQNASVADLRWAGACLVGAGAVVGVLACWRWLSPLAALIAGLGLAVMGGLWFYMPNDFEYVRDRLPLAEMIDARAMPVSLALGIVLIVSAVVLGRRRSRVAATES